jgi:hypothetical protein
MYTASTGTPWCIAAPVSTFKLVDQHTHRNKNAVAQLLVYAHPGTQIFTQYVNKMTPACHVLLQ